MFYFIYNNAFKVDRLYGWKPVTNRPIREALEAQDEHVRLIAFYF